MLRIARQILIPVVFLAAAAWLLWWHSLLLNCALWISLPFLLWGLGERRREALVPGIAVAGLALGLALSFLAARHVLLPRYAFRAHVSAVASSLPMQLVPPDFAKEETCGPGPGGKVCRDFANQRIFPRPVKASGDGILLLGCSFTDASFLPDEHAFATVLARKAGRPVRSLAVSGAGMNTMLFRLENGKAFLPEGFRFSAAIYTFIPHHLPRTAGLGNMRFAKDLPHYELEGGKPVLTGTHFTHNGGNFWVRKLGGEMLFYLVGLLYTAQGGFLQVPQMPPGVVELAAAQVNEMAELLEKRHGSRLVLNLWPGSRFPDREAFLGRLSPKIEVWEAGFEGKLDHTGHPDPEANRRMGEFLAEKLSRKY